MRTGIGVVVAITVIFVLSGLKILNQYERSPGTPPRYFERNN